MNKIEEQILKNQATILSALSTLVKSKRIDYFLLRVKETEELLNPKINDEPCCDMEEDALEVKQDAVSEGQE